MRIALAILASLAVTAAHAEKLFTPVYIKQTTGICGNLTSLQYRDSLIREGRTESLSGINTMATFTGECGNVPEGQWMFLDGWSGNYVCLRPRLGADCAWVRRSAIGEVAELYPGRTFEQGNNGVSCAQWAAVVEKSAAKEKDYTKKWLGSRPKNVGEEFAQGMLSAVVGTFTGGPDSGAVNHANACVYYFATAQEQGRRLTAYAHCPALGANGKREQERALYQSTLKLANDSCAPH
jgi:hypothetical protein